jgi:hypothetical protein
MILSGIIAASGKRAGPPSPDPPPEPVYQFVGEPNADGTAGGTHNFQASNILAQRYTIGAPAGLSRCSPTSMVPAPRASA